MSAVVRTIVDKKKVRLIADILKKLPILKKREQEIELEAKMLVELVEYENSVSGYFRKRAKSKNAVLKNLEHVASLTLKLNNALTSEMYGQAFAALSDKMGRQELHDFRRELMRFQKCTNDCASKLKNEDTELPQLPGQPTKYIAVVLTDAAAVAYKRLTGHEFKRIYDEKNNKEKSAVSKLLDDLFETLGITAKGAGQLRAWKKRQQ